jgi:hypothetical protein
VSAIIGGHILFCATKWAFDELSVGIMPMVIDVLLLVGEHGLALATGKSSGVLGLRGLS